MRLLSSLLAFAAVVSAGPVDFGLAELNAAMAERKLRAKNLAELSLDAPETFRIEPYQIGGAHITGGDLRGLMYGLLEAAAQVRATGRFAKVTGSPAASLRGVRIVLDAELEQASQEFWHAYFRMLARNRFNRVHLVFQHLEAPYELPQFLSRTAADYGIDFTLGVNDAISPPELAHVLMVCPAIRGVAPDSGATQEAVFSALRVAGRRVTLDLDGAIAEPGMMEAATGNNISLLRAAAAWPPSFEVAPPVGAANMEAANMGAAHGDAHSLFYGVMGRLSYDPKAKPPKYADAVEYSAAREIALWIAAAQQSNLGGSDYVASALETAHNRQEHIASAKFTPADIAERLYNAAGRLGQHRDSRSSTAGGHGARAGGPADRRGQFSTLNEVDGAFLLDAYSSGVGALRASADGYAANRPAENSERGAAALSSGGSLGAGEDPRAARGRRGFLHYPRRRYHRQLGPVIFLRDSARRWQRMV